MLSIPKVYISLWWFYSNLGEEELHRRQVEPTDRVVVEPGKNVVDDEPEKHVDAEDSQAWDSTPARNEKSQLKLIRKNLGFGAPLGSQNFPHHPTLLAARRSTCWTLPSVQGANGKPTPPPVRVVGHRLQFWWLVGGIPT